MAWLLLILAVFSARSALAEVFDCPRGFAAMLEQKLAAMPDVKAHIERMLNDPEVPATLRHSLLRTLRNPDLTVVDFTEELKKTYLLPVNSRGFYTSVRGNGFANRFLLRTRPGAESENAASGTRIFGPSQDHREPYPFKTGFSIFAPAGQYDKTTNSLITFSHELAHIKFYAFLNRNIEAFARKFPRYIFRLEDGSFEVDEQFFHYLNERFAHETEWKMYKATNGRYFEHSLNKWKSLSPRMPDSQFNQIISDYLLEAYGITDPELEKLGSSTLSDIFRKGMK